MSSSEAEDSFACDSDKDEDYNPSESDDSSDEEEIEGEHIAPDNNVNTTLHDNNEGQVLFKKTRRRKRDPSQWASNVRKQKRNNGESYISSRKKLVPAKAVKNLKNCVTDCRLRCSQKISDDERSKIFQAYYGLSGESKRLFLLANSKKVVPDRRRKDKKVDNSKKKYTFQFSFEINAKKIKVCKNFFLGTLNISQKIIYNVHGTKNALGNTPRASLRASIRNIVYQKK